MAHNSQLAPVDHLHPDRNIGVRDPQIVPGKPGHIGIQQDPKRRQFEPFELRRRIEKRKLHIRRSLDLNVIGNCRVIEKRNAPHPVHEQFRAVRIRISGQILETDRDLAALFQRLVKYQTDHISGNIGMLLIHLQQFTGERTAEKLVHTVIRPLAETIIVK